MLILKLMQFRLGIDVDHVEIEPIMEHSNIPEAIIKCLHQMWMYSISY
jgi:hypothetical protein